MKKVLIFGASEFQIPLIETAKKRGCHTCVIDINPHAPARAIADEYHQCSLKDYEKSLAIAEQYNPDGITAGMCDVAVLTVARICEKLGLPGLDPQTAYKATNKFAMIEAFSANNVPCPEYMLLNKNDIATEYNTPQLPFIVKPIDMAGSRGINLVKTSDQIHTLVQNSIAASDCGSVILEEYMVGPEVSVEMVVIDSKPSVLQITDKITSGAPHFVELGHMQPSSLPISIKTRISEVAKSAVSALGIKNSIVHAELIITKSGPRMVELGARMGGDGIQQQLIMLSKGINLPDFAVDLALGLTLTLPQSSIDKYSSIRFIPSQVGTVRDIIIDEAISSIPHLKCFKILCECGDTYEERHDNSARFGYVISQADSQKDSIESCDEAIKKICFIMQP